MRKIVKWTELLFFFGVATLLVVGLILINSDGAMAKLGVGQPIDVSDGDASTNALDSEPGLAAGGPQDEDGADALDWYSAQLHIHGWSNHNAATQPGALQLHTAWADAINLDVIWWSEHNKMYYQVDDTTVSFDQATVTDTLDVLIPLPPGTPTWAMNWYVALLRHSVTGAGTPSASIANGALRMGLANNSSTWSRFQYRALDYTGHAVEGQSFSRPLVSDPVLSFDAALCGPAPADTYAEVKVGLSWHDYPNPRPQEMIYRLVPAGQPASTVGSGARVTYTIPLTTTHVSIPMLAHSAALTEGDDNANQELTISVGARNGASACLDIGNFRYHSREPLPAALVQEHQRVAQRNQTNYGVFSLTSWEQFAGLKHLNPYLPSNAPLLPGNDDIQVQNFVPLVHNVNGLVALNHPFGTGGGANLPPEDQDVLVQALLNDLLPARGWGLDMMEIYLSRARVDLAHHLKAWDLLAANGVPLCGIAASDQHGAPFFTSTYMVTWIEATAPQQDALLDGMRRCRMFFGHIGRFDGVVDLRLGAIPMGSIYPVQAGAAPLQIMVNPLPAGTQVKLVQILAQPGQQLTYLIDHQVVDPTQPVMIDTSQPSFVRVELYAANGDPMAFSNRIMIEPLQCDVNTNGQVNIVDVQLVAGAFGQQVPPAPPAYDLWPDNVIDVRDVMRAADCWIARTS